MPTSDRRTLFSTPVNSPYTPAHKKYKLLLFLVYLIDLTCVMAAIFSLTFPQQPNLFWMNNSTIHHYSTMIANSIGFEKAKSAVFPFIVYLIAECVLIFRILFSTQVNSPYTQAYKKYKFLFFLANFIGTISAIVAIHFFHFPQQTNVLWMNNSTIHHYSTLIANSIGFEKAKSAVFPFIVFLIAGCILIFSFLQGAKIAKAINQEHNNHED